MRFLDCFFQIIHTNHQTFFSSFKFFTVLQSRDNTPYDRVFRSNTIKRVHRYQSPSVTRFPQSTALVVVFISASAVGRKSFEIRTYNVLSPGKRDRPTGCVTHYNILRMYIKKIVKFLLGKKTTTISLLSHTLNPGAECVRPLCMNRRPLLSAAPVANSTPRVRLIINYHIIIACMA